MKQQNTISAVLELQHRWIDEHFERFGQDLAKGQVELGPFDQAANALHRHIYLEEEVLFPEVEARGLIGPTTVMVDEHGQICRSLHNIRELAQVGAGDGRISEAFQSLLEVLKEHNFKEEQILYPSADRLLDKNALAETLRKLTEAQPPDGWICRAHRPD